jgi:hypothetical protein
VLFLRLSARVSFLYRSILEESIGLITFFLLPLYRPTTRICHKVIGGLDMTKKIDARCAHSDKVNPKIMAIHHYYLWPATLEQHQGKKGMRRMEMQLCIHIYLLQKL